jgi:hypothetical protein
LQKYCNDNIVYYVWRTKSDKIDQDYLVEKKKELNLEIQRWENYLSQVKTVKLYFIFNASLFSIKICFLAKH